MEKKKEGKFRLVSVKELAEYIGYAPRTIYNEVGNGTFPIKPRRFGRTVRFDLNEVDRYIESVSK